MPLEQKRARTILVDYLCDKCGIGHMRPRGFVRLGDPPHFPHSCYRCAATMTFLEKYPAVQYGAEDDPLDPLGD